MGCVGFRVGKGRKRGDVQPIRAQAWTRPPGEEGGVYFELQDDGRGSATCRLVAEFNPAKVDDAEMLALGVTLRALGVDAADRLWVERVDGAVDYGAPRRALLLDDRVRLADHFGVGPWGPETERTGYRKGSRLKFQLYDKSAERKAAGVDTREHVTRFEIQLLKPTQDLVVAPLFGELGGAEALRLGQVSLIPYPGGAVTVRALPFNPLGLDDAELVGFVSMLRGLGVRTAINWAKHVMGWRHSKRERLLDLASPVVTPSPAAVWAAEWPSAASAAVERVTRALEWAGSVEV